MYFAYDMMMIKQISKKHQSNIIENFEFKVMVDRVKVIMCDFLQNFTNEFISGKFFV